jgi:hypothetical protein
MTASAPPPHPAESTNTVPQRSNAARAQDQVIAYWALRSASYDTEPGHATHHAAEHKVWLHALASLLPLAPGDVLDAARGAGFRSVHVGSMEAVDRVENEAHPERPPRKPRYVLTALVS